MENILQIVFLFQLKYNVCFQFVSSFMFVICLVFIHNSTSIRFNFYAFALLMIHY